MEALLVFTNLPDADAAPAQAARLGGLRRAAGGDMLAPSRWGYGGEGKIEEAEEVPLLIKTSAARYAALEAAIRAAHPYELPEIVAVPATRGLPEYLAWVAAETATDDSTPC